MTVSAVVQPNDLFNSECHFSDIHLRLRVVNINKAVHLFTRQVDVLLKVAAHGRLALVSATIFEFARFALPIAHVQLWRRLTHNQQLLVLHLFVVVIAFQLRLNVVLHLRFWLLTLLLIFKVHA